MRDWDWSYIAWGFWVALFLVLEVLGNWRWWVPWVSLSETAEHIEDTVPYASIVFFALLVMLVAHIVLRGGFLRASAFGLVVAVAAHLVNSRWP